VYDTFTGDGALTSHTPDIAPVGSSWAILNGTFGNLASGRLPYTTGSNGLALINAGVADCEVSALCRAPYSSLDFRSNADGTNRYRMMAETPQNRIALEQYTALGTYTSRGNSGTGSVPMTDGADYLFTAYCYGSLIRLFVDGVYVHDRYSTDYAANTYYGVGAWGRSWDDFTVRRSATWKQVLVFGDSISMMTDDQNAVFTYSAGIGAMWPARFGGGYNSARTWAHSHAIGGAHIYGGVEGKNWIDQIPAAIGDPADVILVAFGANDASTLPDVTAQYTARLQEVKAGWPGVPIYCMGVLASTVTEYANAENRATMNAKISAACSAEGATFTDCEGWIIPATDTYDGLHPNAAGNAKIALEMLEVVA
jgi:lysophospholipase L1-like esterase